MNQTFDPDDPQVQLAAERIRSCRMLLALTGAGISAESGVPTFRGAQGLWRSFRPEDLATPEAFERNPSLVWEWYAWRRELIRPLLPNAAHHALARYEEAHDDMRLVTQNVDGLHDLAGSRRVIEVHGSVWRTRCVACAARDEAREPFVSLPPRCACGGLLRPDVVWFREPLVPALIDSAFRAAERADVVLVVGTSSLVHPAAGLPGVAQEAGAFVIEVNPEETPLSARADVSLRAAAAPLLPFLLSGAA